MSSINVRIHSLLFTFLPFPSSLIWKAPLPHSSVNPHPPSYDRRRDKVSNGLEGYDMNRRSSGTDRRGEEREGRGRGKYVFRVRNDYVTTCTKHMHKVLKDLYYQLRIFSSTRGNRRLSEKSPILSLNWDPLIGQWNKYFTFKSFRIQHDIFLDPYPFFRLS